MPVSTVLLVPSKKRPQSQQAEEATAMGIKRRRLNLVAFSISLIITFTPAVAPVASIGAVQTRDQVALESSMAQLEAHIAAAEAK